METHEQYPKRCVFDIFGEDRIKEANIKVGDEVTVSFDIDAREYQGRWFNSVRAWRVQHVVEGAGVPDAMAGAAVPPVAAAPAAPVATEAPAASAASNETVDDLPF